MSCFCHKVHERKLILHYATIPLAPCIHLRNILATEPSYASSTYNTNIVTLLYIIHYSIGIHIFILLTGFNEL